jgi:hypothetical protein
MPDPIVIVTSGRTVIAAVELALVPGTAPVLADLVHEAFPVWNEFAPHLTISTQWLAADVADTAAITADDMLDEPFGFARKKDPTLPFGLPVGLPGPPPGTPVEVEAIPDDADHRLALGTMTATAIEIVGEAGAVPSPVGLVLDEPAQVFILGPDGTRYHASGMAFDPAIVQFFIPLNLTVGGRFTILALVPGLRPLLAEKTLP